MKVDKIHNERFGSSTCGGPNSRVQSFGEGSDPENSYNLRGKHSTSSGQFG